LGSNAKNNIVKGPKGNDDAVSDDGDDGTSLSVAFVKKESL
jgi:hypothetical protein